MGQNASSQAGTAVKRAFPSAHRKAAEAVKNKAGVTRATLDVQRDAPIHLRAAAASAAGAEIQTNNNNSSSSSSSSSSSDRFPQPLSGSNSKFDGPLDLDRLSSIVEPGLGNESTRADTLASSRQASFVEELRDQYVADMKTQSDPSVEMARMMGEIGPVISEDKVRANQTSDLSKGMVPRVRTSGVLAGGISQLRDVLYDAEDIAEAHGDSSLLPLQHAVEELALKYELTENTVEQLLRLHAVPTFVNETMNVGRNDMNEVSSVEKRWRGYWPSKTC